MASLPFNFYVYVGTQQNAQVTRHLEKLSGIFKIINISICINGTPNPKPYTSVVLIFLVTNIHAQRE